MDYYCELPQLHRHKRRRINHPHTWEPKHSKALLHSLASTRLCGTPFEKVVDSCRRPATLWNKWCHPYPY
jgi:hypothetical protein